MNKSFSFFWFFCISYIFSCVFLFTTPLSFASTDEKNKQEQEWNEESIRLKYEYQHFVVKDVKQFISTKYKKDISSNSSETNSEFCLSDEEKERIEEDEKNENSENSENSEKMKENNIKIKSVNISAIEDYLEKNIAPIVNQEKVDVTISKDENGEIIFEGYGQIGVTLNISKSAKLIEAAIKNNVAYVSLAVEKKEPIVTVNDEELKKQGIIELVSVGRSNFSGSSYKRIINVTNGASKFNGHIIKKGEIFSFTTQLGEIDGSTGYVKELVILGNKVLPEYGGGLCQVSSTSYRGAMLAGMEIVERHNHSYAVNYYAPHGSDATIYSGVKDFRFKNTSDGDILIQTRRGGHNNNELFFHYYGTKPKRDVKIFGPLKTNYRSPPATKITYDASRPAGSSQTVSHRVTGFNSQFLRIVKENDEILYDDKFLSRYQARGTWIIKGGAKPEKKKEETKDDNK